MIPATQLLRKRSRRASRDRSVPVRLAAALAALILLAAGPGAFTAFAAGEGEAAGETAEKTRDRRRVQYYLFLKVTEVETRRNVFQKQIDITKQVSG